MSFVTTQPESLAAAASTLQGLGSAMAAENAAAATPTTGVVPAAADQVSALQATQFAAYGTLYQQVSAQASAIHEMFVNTLGASAASYAETEASNSAVAGTSGSLLSGLLALLTANGSFPLLPSAVGNGGVIGAMQLGNFGSAASDLFALGSSGFLSPGALTGAGVSGAETVAPGGLGAAMLTRSVGSAGPAGFGGAPVSAGVGQASSVGGLAVPPSWAGAAAQTASPAPAAFAGASTAAPHSTPVTAIPAGMASAAAPERGGFGFGAPRYGVKPIVMPKSAVV